MRRFMVLVMFLFGLGVGRSQAETGEVRRQIEVFCLTNIEQDFGAMSEGLNRQEVLQALRSLASEAVDVGSGAEVGARTEIKACAIDALRILKDAESVAALKAGVNSPHDKVRVSTFRFLGDTGTPDGIKALREYLPKAHADRYVTVLLTSLAKHKSAETRTAIERFLRDDSRGSVARYGSSLLKRWDQGE